MMARLISALHHPITARVPSKQNPRRLEILLESLSPSKFKFVGARSLNEMVCSLERSIDRHYESLPSIFCQTEAIYESYTLVRLSSSIHGETLEEPDDTIGSISHVASITQLYYGSWEMLVMKAYLPFLLSKLGDKYRSFTLDMEYDPTKPGEDDVEYWGLEVARAVCLERCVERARQRTRESWLIAKIYYAYVLEVKIMGLRERVEGFKILGGFTMIV